MKMEKLAFLLCKIFLVVNIVFWCALAVYFSFFKFASNEGYLIFKILLFFEPLFFAISLVGLLKKIKIIYTLSIVFVLLNAVLSIADEVGVYDVISLILNLLALASLLLVWKRIFKKKVISSNSGGGFRESIKI